MSDLNVFLRPRVDDVVADVVAGDAVIIHLTTKIYYSTEGVGGWLWEQLANGHSLGSIAGQLSGQFAVSRDRIERDVAAFADELVREQLVEQVAGQTGDKSTTLTPSDQKSYAAPMLICFRDMQDLLALDPPMPRFTLPD